MGMILPNHVGKVKRFFIVDIWIIFRQKLPQICEKDLTRIGTLYFMLMVIPLWEKMKQPCVRRKAEAGLRYPPRPASSSGTRASISPRCGTERREPAAPPPPWFSWDAYLDRIRLDGEGGHFSACLPTHQFFLPSFFLQITSHFLKNDLPFSCD